MYLIDIAFYIFIVVVICQIIYYGFIFTRFAFSEPKAIKPKKIAVSVLICAKNESDNLKTNLPHILNQDYPDFEIILINDDSTDDTLEVMKSFESNHNNIKVVNVKTIEAFWGNKKYALTLGIKASSNEFLIFTDADCKPGSRNWIKQMSSHFSNSKSIVIGYGSYEKKKHNFLNKLIRFETLLTAVQYFSYAMLGLPYMGVGRNLAYRKNEFFNANGFMSHMNIRSGDDDLFINQVATKVNTALCFNKNSFTISEPENSIKNWFKQKRRHITTAKYYKPIHKFILSLFYITQLLFWVLSIFLLIKVFNWQIVVTLVVFRFVAQYISLIKSAKKLNETDVLYLLPILEIFLILSQFFIFISNLMSKKHHWR